MADDLDELRAAFVDECRPLVERVGDDLLALERAWTTGDDDLERLARLKMDLHTLKGNGALMGLPAVEAASHGMEDLLADPGLAARPGAIDLLFAGHDLIRRLVVAVEAGLELGAGVAEAFVAQVIALRDGTASTTAAPAIAATTEATALAAADSVRVGFRQLDELLELVGEAVISHASIADAAAGARREQLELGLLALGKTLGFLQSALMQARLLPLSTLFGRYGRYVRDLGREREQAIALDTRGGDTPIDKSIIDRLGEPLLHLVRNAVAHGVEPVAARLAAGKPAEATVTLAAELASDRVLISVADDGRGLDLGSIRARGAQLGLDVERLDDADVGRLIFTPGFSTAPALSTLAGRGVGLDVVAATVASLGGRVEVESQPGRGTRFVLDLPLTLAVVKGLLVEVEGEVVVVPMTYVVESFRLPAAELGRVDRATVLPWRDGVIELVDGAVLLGHTHAARRRPYCVVLAVGNRRRGLAVDRLLGHQDVVVKRLGDEVGQPELVAGATILGDGRVALILDLARVIETRAPRRALEARHGG